MTVLRVLYVEDDPLVARAVSRRMQRAGHDVTVATCCADALKAEGPFDCAVLDVELPDGTGIQLAREILGERTPVVVFFSGVPDRATRLEACDLGTFVPKSEGADQLLLAMTEAVREVAEQTLAAGAELTPNGTRSARTATGPRRKTER